MNARTVQTLKYGWRFTRAAHGPEGCRPDLDDRDWQEVRVPHDWGIGGPFSPYHDVHVKHDVIKTGRTGGLPHVGLGWYRLRLALPAVLIGSRIGFEFDGVMSHSDVFLNGTRIGGWAYGYTSFACDATEAARPGEENVLAVRVENRPLASRWYPGAGIYRNVRLVVTHPVHVARHGTRIVTQVGENESVIGIATQVENHTGRELRVQAEVRVVDADGVEAGCAVGSAIIGATGHCFHCEIPVVRPRLWDINDPYLYSAVTSLSVDGEVVEETVTPFGIRTIVFDADRGFFLNGRRVRLHGVCLHHDLGALGAAVNRRAIDRQLELLKEMGCNALRTTHNPPAPEQLDACDRLGILVIVEAFDAWRISSPGLYFDYAHLFDQWAERDLAALVRRDRNHPSVIMWSIGNEVMDQHVPQGRETAAFLTGICHREDPTRPVTAGFSHSEDAIANGLASAVDIPGWNYKWYNYESIHREHPGWPVYGSETDSCVSTRGVYHLPLREVVASDFQEKTIAGRFPRPPKGTYHIGALAKAPDLQCSSYDLGGSCLPDYEFAAQDDLPFVMGHFAWTGFDYLGEPMPFHTEWPSRSSYFGILDTCGFPKDRYYLYRSRWSGRPVLHLLPHWTWPGREGQSIPVFCYTDAPAAELFLNGRSLGVRRKNRDTVHERFRLIWEAVPYEPGELRVVALDGAGAPRGEHAVRTAGPAASLRLSADRTVIAADGDDLCFVSVSITDERGELCPDAANLVRFACSGVGDPIAVDNGDPTSVELFTARERRLFHGRCLAVVRSRAGLPGTIRLAATADGLAGVEVEIQSANNCRRNGA